MKLPKPLLRGKLIKRYKRFLADVELEDGRIVTAHCVNSGSMLGIKEPDFEVWLSQSDNPRRKLKYTWELIKIQKTLVGVNTSYPNVLVAEAIENGVISELAGYDFLRREVKYGKNSRIDLLLEGVGKPPCYVEVKSVTLKRKMNDKAEFPDAVTIRGAKHLIELADMVSKGNRAVMIYLVQREDCVTFTTADDIDPSYGMGLRTALEKGVKAYCYACHVRTDEIKIAKPLPIIL